MVDKDKQIEEMAEEICSEYDCVVPCQSCAYYGYENCRNVKSAEKLYNAGYRKASEVAKEIIVAADETIDTICIMTGIEIAVVGGKYLGLRKKYTEEDDE